MTTTRRAFLETVVHAALLPLVGGAAGCGESTSSVHDSLLDGGPIACSAVTPTIGSNHGHVLVVPLADARAGNSKTYDLSSNGTHAHTVHVGNADFVTLATGGTVMLLSSENAAHAHPVTITCALLATDAGTDAGADAGMDGGTDAGTDAGTDSGTVADSGFDAGTDSGFDAGTDSGPTACSAVTPTFDFNHGHTLTVPAADVALGVQQTYVLVFNGFHMHTLTVTPAHFALLAQGMPATGIASSTDSSHAHTITLTCA